MLIPLVLALFTAAAPPQDPARGVIRGTVVSEPSGFPVARAVIEADDGKTTVHAIADSAGVYRLNVAAGEQMLRVRHLEHAPMEQGVRVPPGGEVSLDVALVHRPIALATVRVIRIDPRADSTAAERPDIGVVIDHQAVENAAAVTTPLSGGLTPNPAEPGTVGDALYVRGSSANLQLVLLDGAPVYAPFHMGGLIDTFEPDVVGSARLYLGGAPARYDGGLSYVMDLSTRTGRERMGAAGTADMVSATARVEGPLGPARYLGSVRTVHGGTFSQLQGEPFPYDFGDGLFRFDLPLPDGGVSTTLFANTEGVRVDSTQTGGRDEARWGNLAGSVRYRGRHEGADMELTLAAGRYNADMPLRFGTRWFQLAGRSERLRAGLDFTRTSGALLLRYGASYERTWMTQMATAPAQYKLLMRGEASGSTWGGYLDGSWQPGSRVVLRAGLRGDAFSVGGRATVAPRGSATVLVGDGAALTLAGGRYHQYIRVPRPLPRGSLLRNFADSARIPTHMAVAGATHLSLELDQQMGGGVRLGLEGFYKRYDGLPPAVAVDSLSSTAHSSGVDVWVRRTGAALTGWFGYSLNWVWSSGDYTGIAGDFVGRQTVSAGVRGLGWKGSVVGVRVAYGAPISSRDFGNLVEGALGPGSIPSSELNSGADLDTDAPVSTFSSAFLRLDAEISRTWAPRVAGRATEFTPYLRVINALDQRDGFFYRYTEAGNGENGVQPIATVPLVPVFGVTWKI
ncbi:TonB-dependent receptor [Longimicrobium sp.]|uniref:TonB-dependent receptor n=1 Tax=Longimicrobium sp. TaxID=2029185 RepID=UPI003B3BB05E